MISFIDDWSTRALIQSRTEELQRSTAPWTIRRSPEATSQVRRSTGLLLMRAGARLAGECFNPALSVKEIATQV